MMSKSTESSQREAKFVAPDWPIVVFIWAFGLGVASYVIARILLYSIERFLLSFTSAYQVIAFGLTQSQLVALVALAAAVPLLIRALTGQVAMRRAG
jgi:uncharacterized membrane protein YedE/YeeE